MVSFLQLLEMLTIYHTCFCHFVSWFISRSWPVLD